MPRATRRPRSGRRSGPTETRDSILAAAREAFAGGGYGSVSMRGIARAAGVDPALVLHFFGNKAGLYVAAIPWPFDLDEDVRRVVAGGPAHLGENLAAMFVDHWEHERERSPIVAMLHVATGDATGGPVVREYLAEHLLAPVMQAIGVDEPDLRSGLIAAQLIGMGLARYVLAFEPLASAPAATVTRALATSIQRVIDDPLPEP